MVNTKIRLILFFASEDGETLYSQQKQDQELTGAQILNSLLPNSLFCKDDIEKAGFFPKSWPQFCAPLMWITLIHTNMIHINTRAVFSSRFE